MVEKKHQVASWRETVSAVKGSRTDSGGCKCGKLWADECQSLCDEFREGRCIRSQGNRAIAKCSETSLILAGSIGSYGMEKLQFFSFTQNKRQAGIPVLTNLEQCA